MLTVPVNSRSRLIKSMQALKKCDPHRLQEELIKLYENNQHYFKASDLKLAGLLLTLRYRCSSRCAAHDQLDEKVNQLFHFTHEDPRVQHALSCAEQDPKYAAEHVQTFGIQSEEGRALVAQTCMVRNPLAYIDFAKNFAIHSEETQLQLALLCAQTDHISTAQSIRDLHVTKESDRIKLALCLAHEAPGYAAQNIKQFAITCEKTRLKILKKCLEGELWMTAGYFSHFNIQNKKTLFKLARSVARKAPACLIDHLPKFHIAEEKDRIRLAKICIRKFSRYALENIQKLGIQSEEGRLEIIKAFSRTEIKFTEQNVIDLNLPDEKALVQFVNRVAKRNEQLPLFLHHFKIPSEEGRLRVAQTYAAQFPRNTIAAFEQFGLQSEASRMEIAKICILQCPSHFIDHIQKFGIQTEKNRFELAKMCAENKPDLLAEKIKKFSLNSEKDRIELACICLEKDPAALADHILKFSIDQEEVRIRIAKACALKNAYKVVYNIKDFAIHSEEMRTQILTICAENRPDSIPIWISDFAIHSEEIRIAFAKICAKRTPGMTAAHILNFNIQNQAALVEIALICAEEASPQAVQHFQNFGIQSEVHRIQIAKYYAERHVQETASGFSKFGFEREEVRIELAWICAKRCPESLSANIREFHIQNESVRIALARFCAKESPKSFSENIQNFYIHREEERFRLAKTCMKRKTHAAAKRLQNFHIHDETSRYKLAMTGIELNPKAVIHFIQQFGHFTEKKRLKLALECAVKRPKTMSKYLREFAVETEKKRMELVHQLIKADPLNTFENLQISNYLSYHCLQTVCALALRSNINVLQCLNNRFKTLFDQSADLKELFPVMQLELAKTPVAPEVKSSLHQILDNVCIEPNVQLRQHLGQWIAGLLTLMAEQPSRTYIHSRWFLTPLSAVRDPELRWQLSVIQLELTEEHLNSWQHVVGRAKWNLLAIPLCKLQQQGLNANELQHIAQGLIKLTQLKNSIFHDKINMRLLLSALCGIVNNQTLTVNEKEAVLKRLFYEADQLLPEKTILNRLSAVNSIMRLGKHRLLAQDGDLSRLFERAFQEVFPIKDFHGNFLEAFNARFQSDRHITSLMKYAASVKALNHEKALECLATFTASLLNNTFLEKRYSLDSNPHLNTLATHQPDFLIKWREPLQYKPSADLVQLKDEPLFDPKKWLKTQLIEDNHATVDISEFKAFLTSTPEEKRQILASLGKKSSRSQKENLKQSNDEQIRNKFLSICCKLAEMDPHKPHELNAQLNNLLKVIKGQSNYREFRHALKERLNGAAQKANEVDDVIAEVTDAPFSILHAGTDVIGSCQRVDGDPKLNCGLLAYLMDGKLQMAALKDSKGKIVARCMLKVLWDGSKPVLYRERMYPEQLPEAHKKILNDLVKKKAQAVELALVSADTSDKPYPAPLQALGGPVPFEYSDGGGIQMTNGTYTINHSYFLQ